MNESQELLKNFIIGFFGGMKSIVEWRDNVLTIDRVPGDFETFYGKKAPYHLVFDREFENGNTELMAKGSFLIKTMNNYLENRGQTTLLRIDFPSVNEELARFFKFENCTMSGLDKKKENKTIVRFSFATTLQYINEKEQLMNSIYIEDGKVIPFKIEDWKTSDGKKEEVSVVEVKESYAAAKDELKLRTNKKVQEASDILYGKLEKEQRRIREHYGHLMEEIDFGIRRHEEQIKDIEKQIKRSTDENIAQTRLVKLTDKDIEGLRFKIVKIREIIVKLETDGKKEALKKECEFVLNDEVHKYGLNISNNLLNTSIIYYPIYDISFTLRGKDSMTKQINLKLNSLKNEITPILCESCSASVSHVNLCSSGHVSCVGCMEKCMECQGGFCKICGVKGCEFCGKKVCRKCTTRCLGCSKTMCKSHTRKVEGNARELCFNCIKNCASCSKTFEKSRMKKCAGCMREYCKSCSRANSLRSASGRELCKACAIQCSLCSRMLGRESFGRLPCSCRTCSDMTKCTDCRNRFCPKRNGKTLKV